MFEKTADKKTAAFPCEMLLFRRDFIFFLISEKAVPSAGRRYLRLFLNFCGRGKLFEHFFGKWNCLVATGTKIGRSVVTGGNNYGFSAIGAKNFDALVFIVILKVDGHFQGTTFHKFILQSQYITSSGGMQEANPPFFRNCGLRPAGR